MRGNKLQTGPISISSALCGVLIYAPLQQRLSPFKINKIIYFILLSF